MAVEYLKRADKTSASGEQDVRATVESVLAEIEAHEPPLVAPARRGVVIDRQVELGQARELRLPPASLLRGLLALQPGAQVRSLRAGLERDALEPALHVVTPREQPDQRLRVAGVAPQPQHPLELAVDRPEHDVKIAVAGRRRASLPQSPYLGDPFPSNQMTRPATFTASRSTAASSS